MRSTISIQHFFFVSLLNPQSAFSNQHFLADLCLSVGMNQLDLNTRVAVITGGARGIGFAAAARALRSGAIVSLWDVDAERLETARQELSPLGSVSTQHVELSDRASVERAAAATIREHGRIDILVNNAGIAGGNGLTWELDPDVWRRVIDVNLTGPFLTARAVVPHMLSSGYGRIVNVSSIAGKEGNPNASHYSASKAGLIGLTKSLAKELATRNILVNCITPAAAKNGHLCPDETGAPRLHAVADTDGTIRRGG